MNSLGVQADHAYYSCSCSAGEANKNLSCETNISYCIYRDAEKMPIPE
jgi:hypothetical protein